MFRRDSKAPVTVLSRAKVHEPVRGAVRAPKTSSQDMRLLTRTISPEAGPAPFAGASGMLGTKIKRRSLTVSSRLSYTH